MYAAVHACASATPNLQTKSARPALQYAQALRDNSGRYYCALNTQPNKTKKTKRNNNNGADLNQKNEEINIPGLQQVSNQSYTRSERLQVLSHLHFRTFLKSRSLELQKKTNKQKQTGIVITSETIKCIEKIYKN